MESPKTGDSSRLCNQTTTSVSSMEGNHDPITTSLSDCSCVLLSAHAQHAPARTSFKETLINCLCPLRIQMLFERFYSDYDFWDFDLKYFEKIQIRTLLSNSVFFYMFIITLNVSKNRVRKLEENTFNNINGRHYMIGVFALFWIKW